MTTVGFEPAIPVSERPQTQALDGAVTGIGAKTYYNLKYLTNPSLITFT